MRYLSLLILFSLLLFSCANEDQPKKTPLKFEKHLAQSDFYELFRVKAFQQDRAEYKGKAKEIFYKGINAYKNNKDLDSGAYYLENSIRIYPTANAYYELGNILNEQDYTTEALQAYQVAEGLGYEPLGSVLIQISRVHAKKGDFDDAGDYLLAAIQGGYTNQKLIESHPDYLKFKETWYYKDNFRQGFSGLTEPEHFAWFQFKKQFPVKTLPFTVESNLNYVDFENMNFISFDFETYVPGMRDEKFAREVGRGNYFYANIGENENYVACLYITREENYYFEEDSDFMEELYETYLCTYNHEGKIIDLKKIAGRSDYEELLEETEIDILGNIQITQFACTYEKDPKEKGYLNNPVVAKTKVGEKTMRILASGKIVDTTSNLANTPVAGIVELN
ncbi:MAG: hypothetical protein N4A41_03370 [Crocinitomicaceae bacterium]|nr:hypothetical protein [Crocinitomicaceae bacterium]